MRNNESLNKFVVNAFLHPHENCSKLVHHNGKDSHSQISDKTYNSGKQFISLQKLGDHCDFPINVDDSLCLLKLIDLITTYLNWLNHFFCFLITYDKTYVEEKKTEKRNKMTILK